MLPSGVGSHQAGTMRERNWLAHMETGQLGRAQDSPWIQECLNERVPSERLEAAGSDLLRKKRGRARHGRSAHLLPAADCCGGRQADLGPQASLWGGWTHWVRRMATSY